MFLEFCAMFFATIHRSRWTLVNIHLIHLFNLAGSVASIEIWAFGERGAL